MKINIPEEWSIRMAKQEAGQEVGAGLPAFDPEVGLGERQESAEPNMVFGRFVHLLRRQRRLSREELAEAARIELGELIKVEDDLYHKADLRTVYQFALFFGLPKQELLQLAGLTIARDRVLTVEAERFAARSDPLAALTPEEQGALDAFVKALAERN